MNDVRSNDAVELPGEADWNAYWLANADGSAPVRRLSVLHERGSHQDDDQQQSGGNGKSAGVRAEKRCIPASAEKLRRTPSCQVTSVSRPVVCTLGFPCSAKVLGLHFRADNEAFADTDVFHFYLLQTCSKLCTLSTKK